MDKKWFVLGIMLCCLVGFIVGSLAKTDMILANSKKILINKIQDREKASFYNELLIVKKIDYQGQFTIVTYEILNDTFRLITLTDKINTIV
jgi:hypothetical protein